MRIHLCLNFYGVIGLSVISIPLGYLKDQSPPGFDPGGEDSLVHCAFPPLAGSGLAASGLG